MKLNPININFGRRIVATCEVRISPSKKCRASIYEYNPQNEQDVLDIKNSPYTTSIKGSFERRTYSKYPNAYKYYAICDNSTGEIIACTQLSQHCSQKENQERFYTSIDELETNSNYIDPITPMLGYIAHNAQQHSSNNITTSFRTDEIPELKKCGFKATKSGNFSMHENEFDESLTRAYYRNNLEFVV